MRDESWLLAGIFLLYSAGSDLRCGMISVKSCFAAAGAGAAVRWYVQLQGSFVQGTMVCEIFAKSSLMRGPSAQEAVVQRFVSKGAIFTECLRDLLPGLFVMGLAIGSGEEIGKGDAWIMLALGLMVGAGRCMSLFVTALIVAVPFALVWRFWGKRRNAWEEAWERSFPFAPNLFIAHVLLSLFS